MNSRTLCTLTRVCVVATTVLLFPSSQSRASEDTSIAKASYDLTAATSTQRAANIAGPIKDSAGRIRYIVDLIDDHADKPAKYRDATHKLDYYKTKSAQLIADVSKLRSEELLGTTSLVGTSFTAYLTEKQVEQFAKDKRVKLITQDAYL